MEKDLSDFISYTSMYSVILPMIIGVLNYKRLSFLQRLIALVVIMTLVGEAVVYFSASLFGNNLPVIHFFTILQFIILVLIMAKGLTPLISKITFRLLITTFILFAIIDAIWLNGIYSFNIYSRPIACIILLLLALLYFYKTLKELKINSLGCDPLFWISNGILIYFSGNLFIFLFTNYVKSSNEALLTLWGIHAIFNIILNISYSIALWVKPAN